MKKLIFIFIFLISVSCQEGKEPNLGKDQSKPSASNFRFNLRANQNDYFLSLGVPDNPIDREEWFKEHNWKEIDQKFISNKHERKDDHQLKSEISRIILIEGGLINSKDPKDLPKIKYYSRMLLKNGCLDITTVNKVITVLKNNKLLTRKNANQLNVYIKELLKNSKEHFKRSYQNNLSEIGKDEMLDILFLEDNKAILNKLDEIDSLENIYKEIPTEAFNISNFWDDFLRDF